MAAWQAAVARTLDGSGPANAGAHRLKPTEHNSRAEMTRAYWGRQVRCGAAL
jgi:hypothetical protein